MVSVPSRNDSLIVYHPPLQHPVGPDEVVAGTFHFGGTCVGLQHDFAGQRLQEGSILHDCSWGLEENEKGPDGQHGVAFRKPGSASLGRRRGKSPGVHLWIIGPLL